MHDVFSDIRNLLKVDSTAIDNNVFRLHYKLTMFILMASSLLLTQVQYFGDPIDCIVGGIDDGVMDAYCWIHGTHTIPALTGGAIGTEVAHPGVAPLYNAGTGVKHEIKHHKYYQWVTFFLFFQAVLFYLPRYFWKLWEGGRIKMLVNQLDSPIVDEDAKKQRKNLLVNFFHINLHGNDMYAGKYFVCELLNFVNVIGQIYFTDRFLGYEFTTYGTRVIDFMQADLGNRHDPMDEVFPKVTKCTFRKFGASASHEIHDGLCVLPLNILSEKIFIFLWFWYIIVAVISGVALLYRIAIIALPPLRHLVLRARSSLVPTSVVDAVANKCNIGDWFLLYQISKNMDPQIYKEFITELSHKLYGINNTQ